MTEQSHRRWRLKQFLALAVIASLVPVPVLAGEGSPPTAGAPGLRASAAKVVAREVLKSANDESHAARSRAADLRSAASVSGRQAVAPATARAEQGSAPGERSGRFFKSGAGIAVLAVFAAGVGYALYSTQHDRVHSAGKK